MAEKRETVVKFFAGVFGMTPEDLVDVGEPPEGAMPRMSAVMRLQNQPEFWADAPWRLEPDVDAIPLSFHVRDADLRPPAKGPWRLDLLLVEQRLPGGDWHKLLALLPADLPEAVDGEGHSRSGFWVHGASIPLAGLSGVRRGQTVHLRAVFSGRFPNDPAPAKVEVHLETLLAEHPLPLGRAAGGRPRRWFYGDTHYHSAYTDDVKEFGGEVREARKAAQAIGLDWLVVTDHSCDLDEVDGPAGGPRRWDRLAEDVPALSDDAFRLLLGEEITLLGRGGRPLHLLAFGGLEDMVEGAFLPYPSGDAEIELVRRGLERILKAGRGYPPGVAQRLFGRMLRLDEVMERLPPGALAFAAHPFSVAQVPPGKWTKADLSHPRLTGYEFWNGRIRASAGSTDDPFSKRSWTDAARLQKADAKRIETLKGHAGKEWDAQLQRGVEEWPEGAAAPAWRPVFVAGSDAHCDFNYHVGWAWDYRQFDVNDGAFARVRTVVYLPGHDSAAVPAEAEILAALRQGSCVVTDGPVVECALEQDGRVARLGEVLEVSGPAPLRLRAVAHTTPDFGPVRQIEVVCYGRGGAAQRVTVPAGGTAAVDVPGGRGYLRVEAGTAGPDGQAYCCFTNPIWLRAEDGGARRVTIGF